MMMSWLMVPLCVCLRSGRVAIINWTLNWSLKGTFVSEGTQPAGSTWCEKTVQLFSTRSPEWISSRCPARPRSFVPSLSWQNLVCQNDQNDQDAEGSLQNGCCFVCVVFLWRRSMLPIPENGLGPRCLPGPNDDASTPFGCEPWYQILPKPAYTLWYIMIHYNAYTLMHLCERACLGKILLASLCLPRVWLGKRSVSHIRQSELFFLKQGGSQQR